MVANIFWPKDPGSKDKETSGRMWCHCQTRSGVWQHIWGARGWTFKSDSRDSWWWLSGQGARSESHWDHWAKTVFIPEKGVQPSNGVPWAGRHVSSHLYYDTFNGLLENCFPNYTYFCKGYTAVMHHKGRENVLQLDTLNNVLFQQYQEECCIIKTPQSFSKSNTLKSPWAGIKIWE